MRCLLVVIAALLAVGCTNTGMVTGSTGTRVDLSGRNYRMIKAGARGEDTGISLFGFLPIVAPSYADAQAKLYDSVGSKLEGRAITLANQTEDRPYIFLLLISFETIILTADVIEFTDPPPARGDK